MVGVGTAAVAVAGVATAAAAAVVMGVVVVASLAVAHGVPAALADHLGVDNFSAVWAGILFGSTARKIFPDTFQIWGHPSVKSGHFSHFLIEILLLPQWNIVILLFKL